MNKTTKIASIIMLLVMGFCGLPRALGHAATEGQWALEPDWPLQAIHAFVLKDSRVLCVYDRKFWVDPEDRVPRFIIFDPTQEVWANRIIEFDVRPIDPDTSVAFPIFCSGHSQLPDGRVAFFGGGGSYRYSHEHTAIFDPDAPLSDPWEVVDDMPLVGGQPGKRWYPTATTLFDGTVLVVGGDEPNVDTADTPLIFDATKPAGQQYTGLTSANYHLPYYGFNFQLTDGTFLYAGSGWPDTDDGQSWKYEVLTRTLDLDGGSWTYAIQNEDPHILATAVMYGPDLIMKGGAGQRKNSSGSAEIYKLDAGTSPLEWITLASMNYERWNNYLIALPDETILSIGGGTGNYSSTGVLNPEIYDPSEQDPTWHVMAAMAPTTVPYHYHSVAVLLPDARVLIAGGNDNLEIPTENRTAQIFSPPYLFDAQGELIGTNRPQITAVNGPTNVDGIYYGQAEVRITMAAEPQGTVTASLIRLAAATHSFDQNQRFVKLTVNGPVQGQPDEEIRVTAPANGYEAPRGYYMLFVVDTLDGRSVPSKARIVRARFDSNDNCWKCLGHGISSILAV